MKYIEVCDFDVINKKLKMFKWNEHFCTLWSILGKWFAEMAEIEM